MSIDNGNEKGDIQLVESLDPSPLTSPYDDFSHAEEKKVLWKIDRRVMPLAFTVYLITFIDRANVGNARVAGLAKDLHLVGYQFNIALSVFYIFYALWEIPSNIVCKAIGPKIWVPLQVCAFGIVCLATGFIKTFPQFVAVRALLGIAEGGVLPALTLVLARFYTRPELVFRIGIMVSSATLAGAFGGLLASGFLAAGKIGNIGNPWRNIFVFEGLITAVIGVGIYFLMPTEPKEASFLTEEERAIAIARLHKGAKAPSLVVEATRSRLVKQSFLSPFNWLCAFGYMTTNVSVQGVSLFLPTIIAALYPGLPTVQVQLRTVPPYMVAFVWGLAVAYLSNRINQRGWVMLASSPFAIAGYAIFVGTGLSDVHARYAGAFLVAMGAFPLGPFFLAWATNNSATDTEKGIASGLIPGVGQFGALIATWSYLPKDSPNYRTGNSINIGFAIACWSLTATMRYLCARENKIRDRGGRDNRYSELNGDQDVDMQRLGSRHPEFRFSL